MSYHYLNQERESEAHALPDVEVFDARYIGVELRPDTEAAADYTDIMGVMESLGGGSGFYYAFGSPGYMWNSDPCGPFDSETEALKAAREAAGFCEHGVEDDSETVCKECPAPVLYAMVVRGRAGYYSHSGMVDSILKATCWGDMASAYGSIAPVNSYPVRLSDEDARRWGRVDDN